jgi:hypothetical protein
MPPDSKIIVPCNGFYTFATTCEVDDSETVYIG